MLVQWHSITGQYEEGFYITVFNVLEQNVSKRETVVRSMSVDWEQRRKFKSPLGQKDFSIKFHDK